MEKQFEAALKEALQAAQQATAATVRNQGQLWGACGFAWVRFPNIRSNSKLGKLLIEHGATKPYGMKGLQIWNPSDSSTQSIDAREDGCKAFVEVMKRHGFTDVHWSSRLD